MHDELVTEDMMARAKSNGSGSGQMPAYSRPMKIGRHILVRVGTSSDVICFFKNCNVAGSRTDLANFHNVPCERREGDEETRASWGNVTA